MPNVTVQPTKPYPLVGDVLQLARVIVNDAFGPKGIDGDILASSQPHTPVLLKSAWVMLQDELADAGVECLSKEVVIQSFPVVYTVDPAVRVYISWDGCFDGQTFYSVNSGFPSLPYDLIVPQSVWERAHGTATEFTEVVSPGSYTLPEGFQNDKLRWYLWQNDKLYFKGATFVTDLKIPYLAYLPDLDYTNDGYQIPIMRSLHALAFFVAHQYAQTRSGASAVADSLYAKATAEVGKIANRSARRKASISYRRQSFGCGSYI